MATQLMTWRRRGLLLVISALFALSAVSATAQTDGYGPSVSTDREDEIALLGVTWGSDLFYVYLHAETDSVEPLVGARFPNGVEHEPWLGN